MKPLNMLPCDACGKATTQNLELDSRGNWWSHVDGHCGKEEEDPKVYVSNILLITWKSEYEKRYGVYPDTPPIVDIAHPIIENDVVPTEFTEKDREAVRKFKESKENGTEGVSVDELTMGDNDEEV